MTTAYDVVRGALRLIGVVTPIEPPSAEEAADGLSAMNQMLASWAASRYTSASVPQTSFTLTSGAASYTIGAGGAINATRPTTIYQAHITQGGIDFPLRVVALGEYVIEKLQAGNDGCVVKFRAVNDRDQAEGLRGAEVMITRAACAPAVSPAGAAASSAVVLTGSSVGVSAGVLRSLWYGRT